MGVEVSSCAPFDASLPAKETGYLREEAKQSFLASPFFQRWDPAVLDAYVQGGLYEKDGGGA